MADWSKPELESTYANFVNETNALDTDLAVMFDPAVVTPTNFPTNTIRWRAAANKWEKWNGSVWNDLSPLYAINISGNAATASALSSAPGSVLEVGRYFDFHSAANGYDYDVRLDAQAGASAGAGTLVITASNVAATKFTGALVGNATTATGAGGSSFATQATAAEGQLIAQKSGQNTAYLFNNDSSWGLYSHSGGLMASFDRATGKFNFNGNASTATTAENANMVDGYHASAFVFPSGTRMPFAQAYAPTGWTQDTSDNANNRMLRVVSTAGGGVGGSSSPILNNVVPAHTHGFTTGTVSADHAHSGTTGGQSANHTHGVPYSPGNHSGSGGFMSDNQSPSSNLTTTANSVAHTHSFTTGGISTNHTHSGTTDNGSSQTNWTPRYIDMIICKKG